MQGFSLDVDLPETLLPVGILLVVLATVAIFVLTRFTYRRMQSRSRLFPELTARSYKFSENKNLSKRTSADLFPPGIRGPGVASDDWHRQKTQIIGSLSLSKADELRSHIAAGTDQPGQNNAFISGRLDALAFLMREMAHLPHPFIHSTVTPIELFDDVVTLLAPLLRSGQTTIHPLGNIKDNYRVDCNCNVIKHELFNLLIDIIEGGIDADIKGGDQISVHIHHDRVKHQLEFEIIAGQPKNPETVKLAFPVQNQRQSQVPVFDPDQGQNQIQNDIENHSPYDPALHSRPSFSALIIGNEGVERSSLIYRLGLLNVTCVNHFDVRPLDLCFVLDDTSQAFRSIAKLLPANTWILTLHNKNMYQRQGWIQVDEPITQSVLTEVLLSVARAMSEQADKHRSYNILAVDDSPSNLQLLEMQLLELGHKVTCAGSGEAALMLVQQSRYELIFMDIQMGVMDGVAATKEIRAMGVSVPVIGLTAHASSQERMQYIEAGMDNVFIKPVRMDRLRNLFASQRDIESDVVNSRENAGHIPPRSVSAINNLPVFDRELALSRVGGRSDVAGELIDVLMEGIENDQDEINEAAGEPGRLKALIHKLHGAIRYTGAPRLERTVGLLEGLLKERELKDSDAGKSEFEDHLALDHVALINLLNAELNALRYWYGEAGGKYLFKSPEGRSETTN